MTITILIATNSYHKQSSTEGLWKGFSETYYKIQVCDDMMRHFFGKANKGRNFISFL